MASRWRRLGTGDTTGVILRAAMTSVKKNIVQSDPDILGGIPVFVGTRVPVKTLYDYLEAGDSLAEFLHDFPSVSREQAIAALELGGRRLSI